jgi:uncharacterized membrane protein
VWLYGLGVVMRETFWIIVVLFALIVAVMLDDERASEPSRDNGARQTQTQGDYHGNVAG